MLTEFKYRNCCSLLDLSVFLGEVLKLDLVVLLVVDPSRLERKETIRGRSQVTKLYRSPSKSRGRIGLASRIGSSTQYSYHFGLALSLGIMSKPQMIKKINFEY